MFQQCETWSNEVIEAVSTGCTFLSLWRYYVYIVHRYNIASIVGH